MNINENSKYDMGEHLLVIDTGHKAAMCSGCKGEGRLE